MDVQTTGQYADSVPCVYIVVIYHAVYGISCVSSSLFSNLHTKNAKNVQGKQSATRRTFPEPQGCKHAVQINMIITFKTHGCRNGPYSGIGY